MPIVPGTRLGPYEITSTIGSGGMGTVWKALDPRLDRFVAIKTSAARFSERFEREARAIAALNHPRICQIYDVGPDYLVMELIDGRPLEGPLPLDQALKYAAQIADALDAAHRKGIAHRDLKPGNILVTRSGIKLLDFGLAKTSQPFVQENGSPDDTITKALTGRNEIVGTLQYMSPEQLQPGVCEVDVRTDIFSFGLVLYEMLTGQRAFDGASPASIMAAILERPAPRVGAVAPPALDRVVQRCLAKDPDDRWQSARDLRAELEWIATVPEGATVEAVAERKVPNTGRRWTVPIMVALIAIAGVTGLEFGRRSATPAPADWQVSLTPPPGSAFLPLGTNSAIDEISPDGSMVIARSRESGLTLRRINSFAWVHLKGTEGASTAFWAPDSQSIGFFLEGRIMRMRVPDGVPERVRELPGYNRGGAWNRDQQIMDAGEGGLRIGPASGGAATLLLPDNPVEGLLGMALPQFLPDAEHFIFLAYDPKAPEGAANGQGIYLAGWTSGRWTLHPVRLKANLGAASYSPLLDGSVLFVRGDDLYAQHLNLGLARLEGEARLVVRGVASTPAFGGAYFSVSTGGVLAWRPGRAVVGQLTWFNRGGEVLGLAGPPEAWDQIALSPDERHIAAQVVHAGISELRVLEASKSGFASLAASAPNRLIGFGCLWLPGGGDILYPENYGDKIMLMQQSAAGGLFRELGPVASEYLNGLSADGKQLLLSKNLNLRVVPFPPTGSAVPQSAPSNGDEYYGVISPNGKWVAYISGSQHEVFARQLGTSAPDRQISVSGRDDRPRMCFWRSDGKEILYGSASGQLWSVAVDMERGRFSAAVPLFKIRLASTVVESRQFLVNRDGSRILAVQAVEQPGPDVIHVLADWTAAMKHP